MRVSPIAVLLGLTLTLSTRTSTAVEVMRWERLPLAVPLIVGQERVIFVERNVRVGIPAEVENRLRVQSAAGTVYLRANEPIEPTRLQLQDAVTGELILLDIAAQAALSGQTQLEDVRIVEEPIHKHRARITAPEHTPLTSDKAQQSPGPVVLTRYAAQNLYAPLRTVEPLPGVRRVNVATDLSLDLLVPSLPVNAKALAAWRLGELWVTAIHLTNQTATTLDLDPRQLLGDFVTATFQHHFLGPKGTPLDTSVVYITTQGHGLAQSLLPTISAVDAALNLPTSELGSSQEAAHEK
ncbi:TIGR03749 family integrating conjugative element protein [Pseudomonas sp. 91RF]|uniref:TIGR03749 family integrating conjugative element protein n=1 Tax=Pseudomonas sp. 91RF TaxID=2292261 RepID=UPI000E6732FE|nr:TIGR03749 family integrating conjugative element protein [Pseudomonas sp. 91RF]RIJ09675.1 TIGR03749 family integrating conjugative element protein [Pseudomonas sp. 91RF]